MSSLVPSDVIEEIRHRINLVQLIGEVVPLKRSGRQSYMGLCPFHQEKTPSFTVSEQKQLYHCFGCGEGGTIFTFLMKFHHMSFPEALENLASRAGIDISDYEKNITHIRKQKEKRGQLIHVLEYARQKYSNFLFQSSLGKRGMDYFLSRGITKETLERFHLGYAPDSWDCLVKALTQDKRSLLEACETGLIQPKKQGENSYYDVFRNRIMFPICTGGGEVVGFGGRVLDDGNPKYLNSPQTLLFDKSSLLFGLSQAESGIRQKNQVIVVEGYFDQISVFESGFTHCVATLGTALTDSHAKILKRYADEVIVFYDGDQAGKKAALKSIRPLLQHGLKTRMVLLDESLDRDEYIRTRGVSEFGQLLTQAKPALHCFVEEYFEKESDVVKRSQAISELASIVETTKNIYLREAIINEVCQLTGMDKSIFVQGIEQKLVSRAVSNVAEKKPLPVNAFPVEELTLLRLCVEFPQARERMMQQDVFSLFSSFKFGNTARSWFQDCLYKSKEPITPLSFIDTWSDLESRPYLTKIFIEPFIASIKWEKVWNDCLKKLRDKRITKLTQEVALAENLGNTQLVQELFKKVQELKHMNATKHEGSAEENVKGRHYER